MPLPFKPVPGAVEIEWIFLFNGMKTITSGFQAGNITTPGGAATAAQVDLLASEAITLWNDNLKNTMGTAIRLHKVRATALDTNLAPMSELTAGDIQGTAGNDNLPAGVAACVTLKTGGRGRSSRGRMFLPGQVHSLTDQFGLFLPAYVAGFTNFYNSVTAGIDSAVPGWGMVVASRKLANYRQVNESYMNPNPRSQRRRELDR